jgi:hypothetical protein
MRPCGGICYQTCPREAPIRHCSGWGLPCHPCCHVCGGLLPHRFTIALTCRAFSSLWRFPLGYPSRALPGTLASWSPDFPRIWRFPRGDYAKHAIIQPSARDRAYAWPALSSTRFASACASLRSVESSGPLAIGRKRSRKACNTTASLASRS